MALGLSKAVIKSFKKDEFLQLVYNFNHKYNESGPIQNFAHSPRLNFGGLHLLVPPGHRPVFLQFEPDQALSAGSALLPHLDLALNAGVGLLRVLVLRRPAAAARARPHRLARETLHRPGRPEEGRRRSLQRGAEALGSLIQPERPRRFRRTSALLQGHRFRSRFPRFRLLVGEKVSGCARD